MLHMLMLNVAFKFVEWENPLMGWTSSWDPDANVGDFFLYFDSVEAAREFTDTGRTTF